MAKRSTKSSMNFIHFNKLELIQVWTPDATKWFKEIKSIKENVKFCRKLCTICTKTIKVFDNLIELINLNNEQM